MLTPNLEDILSEYLDARSLEALWFHHCQTMAGFGFDRMLYGSTHYRTPNSLGDPSDFLILSNHPPEYTDGFMGKGMFMKGPMTNWALENEGVGSWRIFQDKYSSGACDPDTMSVVAFNYSMNVTAGYTISFKSLSHRIKSAIGLCAQIGLTQDDVDAIWHENGEVIKILNEIMHLKVQNLPQLNPNTPLTLRQREVLQWVGDGKTMLDIATIMDLTPATVAKHLKMARDALNVETTAQAVLKLSMLNQMFIMDL